MVVLDSSIANVALPHIAGSLSASTDESTWVLTSYLVSNGIMLPASGWLARRIGRKRLLMLSILAFTGASMLCGMALEYADADCGAHPAGRGRRRHAAAGAVDPARELSAGETRQGDGRLWSGHCGGAGDWPDAGRMDYRQLLLALDLLHQSCRWACWRCSWPTCTSEIRRICAKRARWPSTRSASA